VAHTKLGVTMSEPVAWMLIDTQTNTRIPRSSEPKGLDTSRWTVKPLYDHPVIETKELEPEVIDRLHRSFDQVTLATATFEPTPVAPTEWLEDAMSLVATYAGALSSHDALTVKTASQPTMPASVIESRKRLDDLKQQIRDHLNKRIA
jgi:hypothetical protein